MTAESNTWACAWFEGTLLTYATRPQKRVTWNTVTGAAAHALRYDGVTPEKLERCLEQVAATAYQPDSARLEQVKRLIASLKN